MSTVFLWLSALAIVAALSIGITRVGAAAIADAQAATAADAAALAGAGAGPDAAARAAQLNGARLVSIDTSGAVTRVEVQVDGARATASAERFFVPIGPT